MNSVKRSIDCVDHPELQVQKKRKLMDDFGLLNDNILLRILKFVPINYANSVSKRFAKLSTEHAKNTKIKQMLLEKGFYAHIPAKVIYICGMTSDGLIKRNILYGIAQFQGPAVAYYSPFCLGELITYKDCDDIIHQRETDDEYPLPNQYFLPHEGLVKYERIEVVSRDCVDK